LKYGLQIGLMAALSAYGQGPRLESVVAAHRGAAIRLMQEKRLAEAAAEFEKALAADANNDDVRLEYATCLFAQERDEEARKQFEIERQKVGDRSGIVYFLGILDVRADQFASAIRRLQPLENDAAFPKAPYYLGLAYLGAGQTARALESLERAAKRDSKDPEAHYRLARIYSTDGRTADADREYKLYREWHATQRLAEEEGRACREALHAGPIASAREVCNRIADPNDARREMLLGQLYTEARDFADAVDPLRTAARLDAKSFEAWQYLGISLYGLNRFAEAVEPLRNAAALNPQYFDTWNFLARTLHMLGNDAAALPALERAHELNPSDPAVTGALERMRAAVKAAR
jgi:Tfp pilus assembly protein PilF